MLITNAAHDGFSSDGLLFQEGSAATDWYHPKYDYSGDVNYLGVQLKHIGGSVYEMSLELTLVAKPGWYIDTLDVPDVDGEVSDTDHLPVVASYRKETLKGKSSGQISNWYGPDVKTLGSSDYWGATPYLCRPPAHAVGWDGGTCFSNNTGVNDNWTRTGITSITLSEYVFVDSGQLPAGVTSDMQELHFGDPLLVIMAQPEPETWALPGLGLVGVVARKRGWLKRGQAASAA